MPQPIAGEEPTYSRSVFEAILAGMGSNDPFNANYAFSDDGVRVKHIDADGSLAWHPWCEAIAPGSPNPLDEPWLRFPFTARQLAALMIDGWGYFIQEKYGDWHDGPYEDELLSIGPLGGKAKEALRAAYAAYRHAAEMAPPLDRGLAANAGELAKQYREFRKAAALREELREHRHDDAEFAARLATVKEAVADLDQAMKEAQQTADLAYSRWRRAVVQHLLLPLEEVSAECFSARPMRAAELNGRADTRIDFARLATRDQLLEAFGSYGLQRSWFDDLKSRQWLLEARKVRGQGQRGRRCEPLFCPFETMTGLIEKSRKSWLSTDAGWRILENKFPVAWAAVSVGDPREQSG